jgi:hypothetical protein
MPSATMALSAARPSINPNLRRRRQRALARGSLVLSILLATVRMTLAS